MSLIPGASGSPSIHPSGLASGTVASPLPLVLPNGIAGSIGNVRADSSTAQTLLNADNDSQIFNATSPHDVNLPTGSVKAGRSFFIYNRATAIANLITIKASGGSTITTLVSGYILLTALQDNPTTSAHWLIGALSASGIYTPTITNGANVTANIPFESQWERTNNTVNLSGRVGLTTTAAAGTSSDAGVSLPVPSSLADGADLIGTHIAIAAAADNTGIVAADAPNDRAQLIFNSRLTGAQTYYYMFSYEVK